MFIIGTPHSKNAGYHRNDDTPSGGKLTEGDIKTCPHCQAVIKLKEWQLDGAWCAKCQAPICGSDNPGCMHNTEKFGCVPFAKQFDEFVESLLKAGA